VNLGWTREIRPEAGRGPYACDGALVVFRSISFCVRRMLHQSLCSAIGIPHSTQIRTRFVGSVLREKSFWMMDMCVET
jgi:hypothetical protein